MKPSFLNALPRQRTCCAAQLLLAAMGAAQAQAQAQAPAQRQEPIVVTGNPLQNANPIAPVERVSGAALDLRLSSTLGETLAGLPGVASTYFGPNASRPSVRGLDGDRIRVLSNGGPALDVSAVSYDHDVPFNPLAIERIEVLRGPAALLYGGSAMGGAVNVMDGRIAKSPAFGKGSGQAGGFGGELASALGGAAGERQIAAKLQGGGERFQLHVDAASSKTRDLGVPIELTCTAPGAPALAKRVCNSASDATSAAVGTTVFVPGGHVGASFASSRKNYGTVAEDEVTIRMKQEHAAFEADFTRLGALNAAFSALSLKAGHTDYRHTEFEGSDVGTRFTNKGSDWRMQARHVPIAGLEGVVGVQGQTSRFSALGEEAFAPFATTRENALFVYEELRTGAATVSFGLRRENVRVTSLGNPDIPRFVVGERRFRPTSASLGARWGLSSAAQGWAVTGSLASTQRAPKDYELLADGPHLATAAYEVGQFDAKTERAKSWDLGLEFQGSTHQFKFNAYQARYANYLALLSSGNTRGADGELNPLDADGDGVADGSGEDVLPEYAYSAVRARFSGFELSGRWQLTGNTADGFALRYRLDRVMARNQSAAQALPRIAPQRLGLTLAWRSGPWRAEVSADRHSAQNKVPTVELAVGGYTWVNLGLHYSAKLPVASLGEAAQITAFAKLTNAGNRLAYSASSILTQTAPGKAPLPGRGLQFGVRLGF